MKKSTRIAAVIDIGSNEIKLKIAESGKNGAKPIESIGFPLGLGRDTFQSGVMDFEKADKACEIIKNFLLVTQTYGVTRLRAFATTAVREAENSDYILDQIKIKTGLRVRILDDAEEKSYLFKLLAHLINEKQSASDKPAGSSDSSLMVYIGSGNIGVSFLTEGRISFLRNIRAGSLRIGELFEAYEEFEFHKIMEEYMATFTEPMMADLPPDIKNFIVSGQDIGMIAELCGVKMKDAITEIPKEKFAKLYRDIKGKSTEKIAADYGIDEFKAEMILPAACIYQNLLLCTQAASITASRLLPCDAVMYELLYPKRFAELDKRYGRNTILSARALAKRYNASEKHYTMVNNIALNIYDKMKKIHGLGNREKILLQTAAVLHDIGKYVNIRSHYVYSYELARGSDIVGLNHGDCETVALVCLYHSEVTPPGTGSISAQYNKLPAGNRVLVSKLAAILRIADSLDRSHLQKFSPEQVAVAVSDEALQITVTTEKNIALEQWAFNAKGRFFQEVFGIKAQVRVKKPKR
ncbi:MAG: HD domain-containing protein [Defluviitaleaceae bacterium]|nr:HD domain-containing protein [Defluviitaleaceae bacterium]